MATIVPPPSKRQKLEASEKARLQADAAVIPDNLGSIRVQFIDQSTGKATGPVVAVPVQDSTVKNLETLLNTIQGNVGRPGAALCWQGGLSLNESRIPPNEYHTASPFDSRPRTTPKTTSLT